MPVRRSSPRCRQESRRIPLDVGQDGTRKTYLVTIVSWPTEVFGTQFSRVLPAAPAPTTNTRFLRCGTPFCFAFDVEDIIAGAGSRVSGLFGIQ